MTSIALWVVLLMAAMAQTGGAQTAPSGRLAVAEEVCCAGSFTLKSVLRAVKATPEVRVPAGRLRFTIVRDRTGEGFGIGGTSEDTWSVARDRLVEYLPEFPPLAYVLQSSAGASAILWNPASGLYETRNVWGRDLLQLPDGSQIVYLRTERPEEPRDGTSFVHVWVWAKGKLDREEGARIHAQTEELLGGTVRLTVGGHPLLWIEGGGGFPVFVPAFGALGRSGLQKVQPGLVYGCRRHMPGGPPWCFERRPEQ